MKKRLIAHQKTFFCTFYSLCLLVLDQLPTLWRTFDKPNCAPVLATICVCRKWLCMQPYVHGFVGVLISAFFVCMLQCVFVWERRLSLTFVYIISIASAEQWSVIETRHLGVALLHPWGTQNCCCGARMPRKSLHFCKYFMMKMHLSLQTCLEKMDSWWNMLVSTFKCYSSEGKNNTKTFNFLIWHTHFLQTCDSRCPCNSVSTVCVYAYQHVGQSVCSFVCNSTKRSSQGRISAAFLSRTCLISKDEVSQAVRQRQSDKTAD